MTAMPEPALEPDLWDDLRPLLDRELRRLPDKYRAVVVLCDLEGKSRKEAAGQLGCPEGTVASRLATARAMLAKRLARHGLLLSGGVLAAVLSQHVASASVPTSVVSFTIKAATLFAAGQAAAGVISVKVAALTEGVLKSMLLTKLKIMTAVLLVIVAAGVGAGGLICRTRAEEPANARQGTGPKTQEPKDEPKPVKGDDLYPIFEHGVGRWLAFDTPLQVRHDLETPGLADYQLKLRVSLLVREGKQAEVRLSFTQQGTFKPVLRPRMPGTSHVDLILGDKSIAELRLTGSGFGNEGDERLTEDFFATVPLTVFRKMLAAKAIRGYIYWRSENEVVERNELRLFALDAKALRTLAALDAKAR